MQPQTWRGLRELPGLRGTPLSGIPEPLNALHPQRTGRGGPEGLEGTPRGLAGPLRSPCSSLCRVSSCLCAFCPSVPCRSLWPIAISGSLLVSGIPGPSGLTQAPPAPLFSALPSPGLSSLKGSPFPCAKPQPSEVSGRWGLGTRRPGPQKLHPEATGTPAALPTPSFGLFNGFVSNVAHVEQQNQPSSLPGPFLPRNFVTESFCLQRREGLGSTMPAAGSEGSSPGSQLVQPTSVWNRLCLAHTGQEWRNVC